MGFGSESKEVRPIHEALLIRGLLHRHIIGGYGPIDQLADMVLARLPYGAGLSSVNAEEDVLHRIDEIRGTLDKLEQQIKNRWEDPYG